MQEVGLDVSAARPRLLTDTALDGVSLFVALGEDASWSVPAGVRRENWSLADPKNLPLAQVRAIRDRLRDRVWRLVAQNGWYKRQPTAAARNRRPAVVASAR